MKTINLGPKKMVNGFHPIEDRKARNEFQFDILYAPIRLTDQKLWPFEIDCLIVPLDPFLAVL